MEQPTTTQPTKNSNVLPVIIAGGALVLLGVVGFTLVRARTQTNVNVNTVVSPSPVATLAASPNTTITTPTGQTALPSPTTATVPSTGQVKTIAVEAGAFFFNPKEIRVKKGEKVKIVLTAKDMMHDFVIDELKVRTPITKAGETSTIEFTADKVGTYEYYCSVGQHRKQGQVGKLIVE